MPRSLLLGLLACAACQTPAVAFTLSTGEDVVAETRSLAEMFGLRDVEVRQKGARVEVFASDRSVPRAALETQRAIDRLIEMPEVAPEPPLVLRRAGKDHALAFLPASSKLALYLVDRRFRTCTVEVQLEAKLPAATVSFVAPKELSYEEIARAAPDYSRISLGAEHVPLLLGDTEYVSGAQGLELEGKTARFVFDVTDVAGGQAEADLMIGSSAYDECAELVFREANPDLVARAMFPRLAALVTARD